MDYLLLPYYNKTNRQGMLDHFLIVADNVNIPVILYNVPGRTGCNIDVDVVGELSKHKTLSGLKKRAVTSAILQKLLSMLMMTFVYYQEMMI